MARKNNLSNKEIYDAIKTLKKKQSYKIKATGEVRSYTTWVASWEVPKSLLPEGAPRRRITAADDREERAKAALVGKVTEFLESPEQHWQKVRNRGVTLDGYVQKWIENSLKVEPISETMKRRHIENYRHHISPYLGKKQVNQITEDHINKLLGTTLRMDRDIPSRIKKDGIRSVKGLSESTRKNIYSTLSKIFSRMQRDGVINSNPVKDAVKPKVKGPNENIEPLIEKIPALMNKLEKNQDPNYARFLLQCLGLRRSERLGLTWDDIDIDSKRPSILVARQLKRHETPNYEFELRSKDNRNKQGWYYSTTKTGKDRRIPISPRFVRALKAHRKTWLANQKKWNKARAELLKSHDKWVKDGKKGEEPSVLPPIGFENHVFLLSNGALVTPNRDNEEWSELLKKEKLPKYRGHLMRHVTATLLAEDNQSVLSVNDLKLILGHESSAMFFYYDRIRENQSRESIKSIDKKLNFYK